jgi:predicted nucleic acid-binding protein
MSGADSLFLDTNVLVYNFDLNEPVKGPSAQALLLQIFAAGQPVISTQVISEFYWAVTRKIPAPLSHDEAVSEVNYLANLVRIVPMTWDVLHKALQAIAAYGLPLWDAQVFAAAKLNGAATVLSEDFQHRQTIEGVTFLNPFAADFDLNTLLAP